jgi:hypothetical protein
MTQYPQPVYVVRPPAPPWSATAVTGFVLSLLWGFGFLSPFGLALSLWGLRDVHRTGQRGQALAAWGVALGAVGTIWLAVFIGTGIASWTQ